MCWDSRAKRGLRMWSMFIAVTMLMLMVPVNAGAGHGNRLNCNFLQSHETDHRTYEKCEPNWPVILGVSAGATLVVGGLVYAATAEDASEELEQDIAQTMTDVGSWANENLESDERGLSYKVFEW